MDTTNLILIITSSTEKTVEIVTEHLRAMREEFVRLDIDQFPERISLTTRLQRSSDTVSLRIHEPPRVQEIAMPKSVWYRRPTLAKANQRLAKEYNDFIDRECAAALWSLYTTVGSFWMNPPLIGYRLLEHNKLLQLKRAQAVGLAIPDTIITNNAADLLAFSDAHDGNIVVKTISAHFLSESREGNPVVVYTNPVSRDQLVAGSQSISIAPVLAQSYVPKRIELRVTVVGTKTFACAIYSQDSPRTRHDWRRYDFARVRHEVWALPASVEQQIHRLMDEWQLSYGAIDLVLTPDDEYVFLEINPSGQWTWIEGLTKMPISRSIAELLASPPTLVSKSAR